MVRVEFSVELLLRGERNDAWKYRPWPGRLAAKTQDNMSYPVSFMGALKVEQKHAALLGLSMLTDRLGGQIYQFLEQNS